MSTLTGRAALLCTVLGLVCAGVVFARTRQLGQALPVLLELLMAAGLLRLTFDGTWRALATAAAVVVVRTIVVRHGLPSTSEAGRAP